MAPLSAAVGRVHAPHRRGPASVLVTTTESARHSHARFVGGLWHIGSVPAARPARPTAPATPLARTRRARRINSALTDGYPDAHCELDFTTPLELAVATILSAQSTDVGVNKVTPAAVRPVPRPPPTTPAPTGPNWRR